MTDRELVERAKESEYYRRKLFFKYERLAYKHLHILERQAGHSADMADDFLGDTYEVFLKALAGVKTSDKDDKWLFLGWYGFFLKNLRIKYVKDIFKQRVNETSLSKSGDDGQEYLITDVAGLHTPDVYAEIDNRLAIREAYKELTPRQKTIVDYKELQYKNIDIAKKVGISNTLVTFELKKIKDVFKSHL